MVRRRRLIVLEEAAAAVVRQNVVFCCGRSVRPLGLWLPRVYEVWLRQRQSYAEGNLYVMPRHQVHGFSWFTGDP